MKGQLSVQTETVSGDKDAATFDPKQPQRRFKGESLFFCRYSLNNSVTSEETPGLHVLNKLFSFIQHAFIVECVVLCFTVTDWCSNRTSNGGDWGDWGDRGYWGDWGDWGGDWGDCSPSANSSLHAVSCWRCDDGWTSSQAVRAAGGHTQTSQSHVVKR